MTFVTANGGFVGDIIQELPGSPPGFYGLAASATNLYVSFYYTNGFVSEYTTAGSLVNEKFINNLSAPQNLFLSGSSLYVLEIGTNRIGEYTTSGGTVNDIVMAICTGALRSYLLKHDALPDRPLRALVPVSFRTGEEEVPWTNLVSGIIADLPTDCADPVERISLCHDAMEAAKRPFELLPADTIANGAQAASPLIATAATRLASRLRWADRANLLPNNVVISNVPGPRSPMWLDGARLENYIPISIVTDGMGLNITVHSYLDRLDFGLIACRELVPDLWDLLDMHFDEIDNLCRILGVERAD